MRLLYNFISFLFNELGHSTGSPNAVLANRKIKCIYTVLVVLSTVLEHFPLFLCLYESFWKGFESDQRRLTLLVACLERRK